MYGWKVYQAKLFFFSRMIEASICGNYLKVKIKKAALAVLFLITALRSQDSSNHNYWDTCNWERSCVGAPRTIDLCQRKH